MAGGAFSRQLFRKKTTRKEWSGEKNSHPATKATAPNVTFPKCLGSRPDRAWERDRGVSGTQGTAETDPWCAPRLPLSPGARAIIPWVGLVVGRLCTASSTGAHAIVYYINHGKKGVLRCLVVYIVFSLLAGREGSGGPLDGAFFRHQQRPRAALRGYGSHARITCISRSCI